MSARTTRQQARARVMATFSASLERMIPANESVPMRGATLLDFENQVEALIRDVAPMLLEERAALEPNARAEEGGRCPHCASERVYRMDDQPRPMAWCSPHGVVDLPQQSFRCRSCGRTFSPSSAGLGVAGRDDADAARGAAGGARGGDAAVRQSGGGVE